MADVDDVTRSAQKAVQYEQNGRIEAAIYFYSDAAKILLDLVKTSRVAPSFRDKAEEYITRAEHLKNSRERMVSSNVKTGEQLDVERAEFLLYQALELDRSGKISETLQLYTEAVELCLRLGNSADIALKTKLKALATRALERAEDLKKSSSTSSPSDVLVFPQVPTEELGNMNINSPSPSPSSSSSSNSHRPSPMNQRKNSSTNQLEKAELAVLASTSTINGRTYVPFLSIDLNERFAYPVPFTDRHGHLALADKQKQRIKAWMRPDEFMESPKVIDIVDSGTIKQTVVSDCSFVASLAIAARYERRFGKRLVTSIIYPQNNKTGEPLHNPCGKYMIKLHINGVQRKVIHLIVFAIVQVVIDDLLPIGHHGELLCSYSQRKNELWVSLLEKAYMKVMGGYDFPGSNSNIDLHALTGWIPERIAIRMNSAEFDAPAVFEKLLGRFHQGHCLITLATTKMNQAEQDRTGLVEAHAYAVLDLRKVMGKRLLLVKNPWTHLRWKGRFSEKDTASWTMELCKALDYNPTDAQQFDDGVFWIDYESVCHFFDVFYVNWDPTIFPFTYAIHSSWAAGMGPTKDLYTMADNPQYTLELTNNHGSVAVWILLTRHITDKADFANNREYITVVVYKSGQKIYLPFDPKPFIDGARINSPHYLCQMVLKEPGQHKFTLVVAQFEKMNTINYTLRVYSSTQFRMCKIKDVYKVKKKETGEWKGVTAGGCPNSRETFGNNPIYQISLDDGSDDNALLIDLRAPKQFSVGFDIRQVSSPRNKPFEKKDAGSFRTITVFICRPGYTVLTLDGVPAGTYTIMPMTFHAGQESSFFLRVEASCAFSMKRLQ